MRVIPPLTIADSMLTSTTVAEPDTTKGEVAWVSGTTYAVGDKRIRTTTHRVYQRLTAGAGTTPPESDTVNWLDVGPTNRWAMFDLLKSTGSQVTSPLTVVLMPGKRIDSLGLVGLVADSVAITVKVSGVTKYAVTVSLLNRLTTGWYRYFFGAFRYREEVAYFDLPPYTNAEITVTLTRASGAVSCGGLVMGVGVYMGKTQHSAEREGLNFSKIERDEFGTATLIQRRSVPRIAVQIRCKKSDVPTILALIDDLNAMPALWSGLDDQDSGYFPALLLLGVYKKLSVNMDQPDDAIITLELEEV